MVLNWNQENENVGNQGPGARKMMLIGLEDKEHEDVILDLRTRIETMRK